MCRLPREAPHELTTPPRASHKKVVVILGVGGPFYDSDCNIDFSILSMCFFMRVYTYIGWKPDNSFGHLVPLYLQ